MNSKYSKEYLQAAAKFALGAIDTQDQGKYVMLVALVSQMTGRPPEHVDYIIRQMSEGDFSNV